MPTCTYCHTAPTLKRSHVVPKFVGTYIKDNSPGGYMLNTWERTRQQDLHKGPYLCQQCDNNLFSDWESYFSRTVWRNPPTNSPDWNDEKVIQFLVSLAFRYAVRLLAPDLPYSTHEPELKSLLALTENALRDPRLVGRTLFVYPYVHQPIVTDCLLTPGVNHFLSLSALGVSLPAHEDLPPALWVVIPRVMLLFCDRDLALCKANTMNKPRTLAIGGAFDPTTGNGTMPKFLFHLLNTYIHKGQAQQMSLDLWKNLGYENDKRINPHKACYVAAQHDHALMDWQRANCR